MKRNDPFERVIDVGSHDYVFLQQLTEEERNTLDVIAKENGLLIAISSELYTCDLTTNSAIFVERVDSGFHCYRINWFQPKNAIREIDKEKFYIVSGSFDRAIQRAVKILKWYHK